MTARGPIRVLHLRDSPWVDGPGRTIIETAAHVDPAKIEYHIGMFIPLSTRDHPMVAAARRRGLRFTAIPDRGGLDWNIVRHVRKLIDELKIDVLHTSDIRTNLYGALSVGFRGSPSLVATTHGWIANDVRRRMMRVLDKFVLRRFDRIILVSKAMERLLPRWWIPRSRLIVIHNALVLENYGSHTEIDPSSRNTSGLKILNVGRLSPEKAQHSLIRAVAAISRHVAGVELKIAGTGPLESELLQLASQLGISDRVELLGHVLDMPAQYARADVVVQSSLTEGLPNVVLEAALLGVPVIATQVGGTDEVITDGVSGTLVQPGSVEALVAALNQFADDRDRFIRMARTAQFVVQNEFSFTRRTDRVTSLYQGLVGTS